MSNNTIKCVIFDCDGTLVDSEYLCNLALVQCLKDFGVEENPKKMVKRFRGRKLTQILQSLEAAHHIRFKDNFVPQYRALVDELFKKELQACDGVKEVLENLSLPMCVASSGPFKKIETALQVTGLRDYFGESIFSSYDINSWKPEPELFLHAAKEMGFAVNECAVVEDSLVGIQAARAANMHAILFDPSRYFSSNLATKVIHDMRELEQSLLV